VPCGLEFLEHIAQMGQTWKPYVWCW
jgi:hypothetical protein